MLSSSNGRLSGSLTTVVTDTSSRSAVSLSDASMPGDISVAVRFPISPSVARLSEK